MYSLSQTFWGIYLVTAQKVPNNLSLLEKAVGKILEVGKAPIIVGKYLHADEGHVKEWPELIKDQQELGLLEKFREEGEDVACKWLNQGLHEMGGGSTYYFPWSEFMEKVIKLEEELKHPNIPKPFL